MPTLKLRTTRTIAPDIKLVFTWEGGAYIDVALEGQIATEVINVWDYETGKPTIPVTKEALKREVNTWIFEYPRKQLVKEVRENW